MAEEKKAPRRPSKKELADILFNKIAKHMNEGMSVEDALEQLTVKQYDFICGDEYGARLDALTMTPEQKEAIHEATKSARPKGLTYQKKYPADKMELYAELVEFVKARGAVVQDREKQNYRDLDFTIDGKAFRIVLSNPRPKKD